MNVAKILGIFLISLSMVLGNLTFADDLSARIDVLERTVNSMHKSFLNTVDGQKSHSNDDKILNDLSEEMKMLRADIEKLEIKINKYSSNFKIFQASVISKLNDNNSAVTHENQGTMKDNYIINNISSEIENSNYNDQVENTSYEKVDSNIKDDNKAALEYQHAYLLLKQKDPTGKMQYEKAQKAFENFISKHPQNALIGNAHYWIASIYVQEQNHSKAAVEFLNGYKANPKSGRALDNLLGLADSLLKIGRNKETCSTLNKLFDEFPHLNSENKRMSDNLFTNAGCKNDSTK